MGCVSSKRLICIFEKIARTEMNGKFSQFHRNIAIHWVFPWEKKMIILAALVRLANEPPAAGYLGPLAAPTYLSASYQTCLNRYIIQQHSLKARHFSFVSIWPKNK
jgi:hypothetical protein